MLLTGDNVEWAPQEKFSIRDELCKCSFEVAMECSETARSEREERLHSNGSYGKCGSVVSRNASFMQESGKWKAVLEQSAVQTQKENPSRDACNMGKELRQQKVAFSSE